MQTRNQSLRRLAGAHSITEGHAISLSRSIPSGSSGVSRTRRTLNLDSGHLVVEDDIHLKYHGYEITHIDATSHMDGPQLRKESKSSGNGSLGTKWDVLAWKEGVFTVGWLVDVPRHRDSEYVDAGTPVTGSEIDSYLRENGMEPETGDALVIRCGRPAWERRHGNWGPQTNRPGLDRSCVDLVERLGPSVVVCDMMDARGPGDSEPWSIHAILYRLGIPIIDNAELDQLAKACLRLKRSSFLVVAVPLPLEGATGSPLNPLAVL